MIFSSLQISFWIGFLSLVFALGLIVYFLWKTWCKKPFEFPSFEHKSFCDVDGIKICYEQLGQGHDLVLLHGIGASTFVWRLVKQGLAQKYRVTLIDLPGFGYSDKVVGVSYGLDAQATRVAKMMDRTGIKNATLIGSSMGGAISLRLSQLAPLACANLILLNPATNKNLAPAYFQHFKLIYKLLHMGINPMFMRFVIRCVHTSSYKIDNDLVRECLGPFMTGPESVHCFLSSFSLLRDARMPRIFSDIQIPVLILWGELDRVVTKKYMLELHNTIKNSTLITGPTSGHHPQEDDPDWTLREVFQFLDRH